MKTKKMKLQVKIGELVRVKGKTKLWDVKVVKKGIKVSDCKDEFYLVEFINPNSVRYGKTGTINSTCLKKI